MKTTNLLTKTATVAACLAMATMCFAQEKEIVKGVSKGIFETSRTTRGTIQRFVFPRESVAIIRAGIDAGKLQRTVAKAATAQNNSLAPVSVSATVDNRALVTGKPAEKEVLVLSAKEKAFYAPELNAARMIRTQILDIKVLEEEQQQLIAQHIQAHIKNHTLRTLLLEELENYDIYNMVLDLTDYFSLDKPFEQAAFDYTLRHPHQMNLNMRRLMYNPLVDEDVKNRLKYFFSAEYIPVEEYESFQSIIHTAHLQYKRRLAAAQEADIINAQIRYYQEVTDRLRNFIKEKHQLPSWNTRSMKELALYDEIALIMSNDPINDFPQIAPFREALQLVYDKVQIQHYKEVTQQLIQFIATENRRPKWNTLNPEERDLYNKIEHMIHNNPTTRSPQLVSSRKALQTAYEAAPAPTILSLEQTVALFEQFVKTTHRRYPHSLGDQLEAGEIAFEQEETLWDSLEYWRIHKEAAIHPHLVRIINQYPNK